MSQPPRPNPCTAGAGAPPGPPRPLACTAEPVPRHPPVGASLGRAGWMPCRTWGSGLAWVVCAAWALCSPTAAQGQASVYRCGPGQYSQQPCPGGSPLATDPAPDAERQQAAQAQAQRDAARAAQLQKERLTRERAAQGQAASRIGPAPAKTAAAAGAGRTDAQRARKGPHRQADTHGARVAQGPGPQQAKGRQPKATTPAGQAGQAAGAR